MARVLNITNGDCAVNVMQQAGIEGEFLPWRDVLHDGPVPQGLSLESLSTVRSQFIVERGWGEPDKIAKEFIERDDKLKAFEQYEKVILWFEHDLYDQLQLIQILHWLGQNNAQQHPVSIICVDQYLGTLTPAQMLGLYEFESVVTQEQLDLAITAWNAFTNTTPLEWYALLQTDTSSLPFLQAAILRMLQQYPACENGLCRIAQQALTVINEGQSHPWEIFSAYQETESHRFLGDSSFWIILNELLQATPALLSSNIDTVLSSPVNNDIQLTITEAGKEVMNGNKNWLEMAVIDRWIGGVYLTEDNLWCWDQSQGSMVFVR